MLCCAESCPTLCDPMNCSLPGSFVHGKSSGKNYLLPRPPPGDLPNPGIKPRSASLQADSLPSEPPGKHKNTGVGSLSLLQGIFPTQHLLHCRQILYQLSHQGSTRILEWVAYPFSRGTSQTRDQTRGLLHCRQILCQPSYEGSPYSSRNSLNIFPPRQRTIGHFFLLSLLKYN